MVPVHFKLYQMMVRSCEELGYEIQLVFLTDKTFRYKNILERVNSFIHKNIFCDKGYKKRLIFNTTNRELQENLMNLENEADFALVIRPDLLSHDSIKFLKSRTKNMVAYQWDGLNRFPEVFSRIPFFDKFFVFDQSDCLNYKKEFDNLFYINNFYFSYPAQINTKQKGKGLIFIGSYLENRMPAILNLMHILREQKITNDIYLHCTDKKILESYKDSGIIFMESTLSYQELLEKESDYEVILDFDNSQIHKGVSFRTFESLYLRKKLITNNPLVKEFEFYNSSNFFIWDEQNINKIGDFIRLPFEDINDEVIKRYSFVSWINRVFG